MGRLPIVKAKNSPGFQNAQELHFGSRHREVQQQAGGRGRRVETLGPNKKQLTAAIAENKQEPPSYLVLEASY